MLLSKSKSPEDVISTPVESLESSKSSPYIPDDNTNLKRELKPRHTSFLSLAGIIGPGILVGASLALKNGPLSLLLGFSIIGIVAMIMMQSLIVLIMNYPTGGVFSSLGCRVVDPAYGGVVGWCYFIVFVTVLANEYNTTAALLQFWGPQVPLYGYILMFWVAFLGFQFLGVGVFGEAEFWLASLKIIGIFAFYIFSIVYMSGGIKGQPAFGFHYWNDPGALANGFKSVVATFVYASTFYSGSEIPAIAAAESKDPRSLPSVVRNTVFRIIFIYIGIAIFYGATVPYNDETLNANTKALQSPMSIAIKRAGWNGGAHLINAFIIVTCISAINSSIFIGSRTLLHLANEGQAPKILKTVNKHGVPYFAVILTNAFGLISLMNISTGAANAYNYIVNISGVAVFIVWGSVCFYHIRFRQAWAAQGRDANDLTHKGLWYPYLPIAGMTLNIFLALIQGWSYFKPFQAKDWVDSYILLPFSVVLFFVLKIVNKTKWVKLHEADLDTGRFVG